MPKSLISEYENDDTVEGDGEGDEEEEKKKKPKTFNGSRLRKVFNVYYVLTNADRSLCLWFRVIFFFFSSSVSKERKKTIKENSKKHLFTLDSIMGYESVSLCVSVLCCGKWMRICRCMGGHGYGYTVWLWMCGLYFFSSFLLFLQFLSIGLSACYLAALVFMCAIGLDAFNGIQMYIMIDLQTVESYLFVT